MDYTRLGRNIAKSRIKAGFTQEALAEKAEVSTVFISQIETATRKPSFETIYKLSNVLKTSIDNLVENHAENARFSEINSIISEKSDVEIAFITKIVREICAGISNGRVG